MEMQPHDRPPAVARRRKVSRGTVLRALYALFVLQFCGMFVGVDSKMITFLRHFNGDTVKYTRLNARNTFILSVSQIFITPLASSMMDVFGRKSVMLLGTLWCCCTRAFDAMDQSILTLSASTWFAAPMGTALQAASTTATDLFPGDPVGAGQALGLLLSARSLGGVIVPSVSAVLAARNVRLPFIVGAMSSGLAFVVVACFIPETAPQEKPASTRSLSAWLRAVNPFSFARLFTSGPELAILSTVQLLSDLCTGPAMVMHQSLVHSITLGWDVIQRGRYTSLSALAEVFGVNTGRNLLVTSGPQRTLAISDVARVIQNLLCAYWVDSSFRQLVLLPLNLVGSLGVPALAASLQRAGMSAGMGRAELTGCVHSLRLLAFVIAARLWPPTYARCMRAKQPRQLYTYCAMAAAVQLLLGWLASVADAQRQLQQLRRLGAAQRHIAALPPGLHRRVEYEDWRGDEGRGA